jgi:hypothetical protein
MTTSEQDKDRAKDQAKAQLKSIVRMMKRLKHCQECLGDEDCELTDREIIKGIDEWYEEGAKATNEQREQYHDEDSAREAIENDPLDIKVRSDWHSGSGKPTEYSLLLCNGGPAVRVIGDLDAHNQPDTARLEYQDRFTPWTPYSETTSEENELLLQYALQFYYGE